MKIGLLNTYHWDGIADGYQSRYKDLWRDYFKSILPGDWQIEIFEVGQGHFPSDVNTCDGWLITGSGKSCYEEDPWITQLRDLVIAIDAAKVPLVGICFGHQMIAHALGGHVERSSKGFGAGVRQFEFIEMPTWYHMKTSSETSTIQKPSNENHKWHKNCRLLFSHQDQVITLPETAICYASDDFCPIQSFGMGRHIFTLQGHPEFTVEFAQMRLNTNREHLDEAFFNKTIASLSDKTQHLEIGDMIVQFFQSAR